MTFRIAAQGRFPQLTVDLPFCSGGGDALDEGFLGEEEEDDKWQYD